MKLAISLLLAPLFGALKTAACVTGSVIVLWTIDFLCGTDFFQWTNVAILTVIRLVIGAGRSKA